jgi:hypothetical protein
MTRLLLAVLAASLLVSGCAGAEAKHARDLLLQSEQAMREAQTLTYEADVSVTAAGQAFSARLQGAARLRGGRTVDQHVHVTAGGAGVEELEVEALVRDGRAWVRMGGRWTAAGRIDGNADTAALEGLGPELLGRLAPFIEDVSVQEGATAAGRPATVISCRIDTAGALGEVAGFAGASDFPGFDDAMQQVREALDDMRATLVLDPETRMLTAARLTLGFHAEGRSGSLELRLRVTKVNGSVRIPAPPAGA